MKKIEVSTLNATTLDILNVIRENASPTYKEKVPKLTKANDVTKVGEIICGYPALANEFISSLVNRIGFVITRSMTFNNPYERLKKGFLEFGDVIEDIFVSLIKAYQFSDEKEGSREFKKYAPNVKSTFHQINWHVMYPVTIEEQQLRKAFLSMDGVTSLIAEIVDSIYKSAEYDEFLLFKYLMIKSVTSGKLAPVSVGSGSDLKDSAKAFRGTSNTLLFPKRQYNEANVLNNTPKDKQVIFMDSQFNANYDVDVLASAFNMDKATFSGSLFLIDDWTTFDNERFDIIREECDGLEEVTSTELSLMANVKAILCDEEWFQIYDTLAQFTETYIASELRWNYFYHTWKVISHSPFANAVVFATTSATTTLPSSITYTVTNKSVSADVITLTLESNADDTLQPTNIKFTQTEDLTEDGIAVHPYGALLVPIAKKDAEILVTAQYLDQALYIAGSAITADGVDVGDTVTLSKQSFNDAFTVFAPRSDFEVFGTTVGAIQNGVEFVETSNGSWKVTGTLKFIEGGLAESGWLAGDGNFLAMRVKLNENIEWSSVKIGLDPSEGSGLVELLGDPDMAGVFKVTDHTTQSFKVVATTANGDGVTATYSLADLVCEAE